MYFASDNSAGAHLEVSRNIAKHGEGFATSYGASQLDKAVEAKFRDIFECDLSLFFVGTGTAANSLALASTAKAGGIVLCHSEAHVTEDECGAPEFYMGGGRLAHISGKFGKIDQKNLDLAFSKFDPDFVHHGRPTAVTLTQATEIGTVYKINEIEAIAESCKRNQVPLHMDGARFTNALVSLDVTPAEMTWKAGVELLSFGGTKNGCWCAEALVCFNKERATEINFLRKRSGHLFSKSRFMAAQFEAYFENDLWLNSAKQANLTSQMLATGIAKAEGIRLAWEGDANEVFAVMKKTKAKVLQQKGVVFFEWPAPADHSDILAKDEAIFRFVTSFATKDTDVEQFLALLQPSA